jgi:hypothetical protein
VSKLELLLEGSDPSTAADRTVAWPLGGGRNETFIINSDPWFLTLGPVSDAAIALVRIAVGAYVTDRIFRRSSAVWTRDLDLTVHVPNRSSIVPVISLIETTLFWLSGDGWTINLVDESTPKPQAAVSPNTSTVNLLSGGVDSLCGALLSPNDTAYVGHSDNPSVRHSQNAVESALSDLRGSLVYQKFQIGVPSAATRERSTRTRSFMFMALGIAAANAALAGHVLVPENGFTSLNPPLAANRGGPHTTRSTHPTTFAYMNAICDGAGLSVSIGNPYSDLTKGDLVRRAADSVGDGIIEEVIPRTLSCSKGFGNFFRGGDANKNCGACVACMTRRGSILSAGLSDRTDYLVTRLAGDAREKLLYQRRSDISVVEASRGWRPDPATLAAIGPFPNEFDSEAALELLARGVEELVRGLP